MYGLYHFISNSVTFTVGSDFQCYLYPGSDIWTGSNTSCVTFTSGSDCQYQVSGLSAKTFTSLSQVCGIVAVMCAVSGLLAQTGHSCVELLLLCM